MPNYLLNKGFFLTTHTQSSKSASKATRKRAIISPRINPPSITKSMGHHTLKGVVCDRPIDFGDVQN